MLGGFRDLTNAYRFGPVRTDVVLAELLDGEGRVIGESVSLPAGPARPLLPDVGLEATVERASDGSWSLEVASRLFAQYVALDVPGFEASDSWFHLPPGHRKTVRLSSDSGQAPRGTVRALNSLARSALTAGGGGA